MDIWCASSAGNLTAGERMITDLALQFRQAVVEARGRVAELEGAINSISADLGMAADPSCDGPAWLDNARRTAARVIGEGGGE